MYVCMYVCICIYVYMYMYILCKKTDETVKNLYKTTNFGTTQKWSSWAGGHLIKHLCRAILED